MLLPMRSIRAVLLSLSLLLTTVSTAATGQPATAAGAPRAATATGTTGFKWVDVVATDVAVLKANVIEPITAGQHPGPSSGGLAPADAGPAHRPGPARAEPDAGRLLRQPERPGRDRVGADPFCRNVPGRAQRQPARRPDGERVRGQSVRAEPAR